MGSKPAYYGIYEDGRLVFKGRPQEIQKYLGIYNRSMHLREYALNNHKILWRYEVKFEDPPEKEVPIEKPGYKYEYTLANLRRYGNTIVADRKRLDEVLDYLEKNGETVKVRRVPKRKHDKEYWVLEK